MKKILLSMLTISLVAGLAFGATRALFADTETSEVNTFTAGTLDLKVDGQDDPLVHITLANMKPGDGVGGNEHSTITYFYTLSNSGSLEGQPWIEIINLENYDNGCNEPEADVPDGTCGNTGLGEGELGANLYMQINAAGSGGLVYPNDPSCFSGRNCPLDYWGAYGPVGQGTWEDIPAGGSTAPMVLEFSIPTSVDNIIQSDSVEFDIVFHLDQI